MKSPLLSTRRKIGIARVIQLPCLWFRTLSANGTVARCRRGRIHWELDLNEGIDFSVFLLGRFEPSTAKALRHLVKAGDHVIDIGANMGAHTLPLAKHVGPNGRVLAVEPTESAFGRLRRNVELNPEIACRIDLNQIMLAETPDTPLESSIYSSWPLERDETDLHPLHRARGMSTAGARVSTLDLLAAEKTPDRVNLIKLDVDGHECGILDGAQETLGEFKPVLVLECAPYALKEKGASLEKLLDLLFSSGYRLYDERTRDILPSDAHVIAQAIPPGSSRNVIATVAPRDKKHSRKT